MVQPNQHFDWEKLAPRGPEPTAVADPRFRLRLIYGAFVLWLLLLLARAAVLEATGGEAFRQNTDRTRTVSESIPSLRGRLLSRDGTVLACDETIASLAVDYRYLEDPPNPVWLRSLARRRFGRAARDPGKLSAELARIRVEIVEMNRTLAGLCGMSPSQWRHRCRAIQRQVETIAGNVNARRQEQFVHRMAAQDAADGAGDGLASAVRRAILELFTPPAELPPPRILIREQQQAQIVARGLSLDIVAEIESRAGEFPGVEIRREVRRSYPQGALAAHVVGYVGAAATSDTERLSPESVGRCGAERAAERWLQGATGISRQRLDSRGQILATRVERSPQAGRDVVLSLDAGLQRRAETLLDAFQGQGAAAARDASLGARPRPATAGGAVVVMDVHSGAVLAAATAPRFDPKVMLGGAAAEVDNLLHGAGHPMLDRTAQMALPPGSVFKALTAIAMLQSDGLDFHLDPRDRFDCRGYLHHPDAQRCMIYRHFGIGHGPICLREALAQSCNVYFQHHAGSLGPEAMLQWSARLGFGSRTRCDWTADSAGILPKATAPNGSQPGWTRADTEAIAIGQGRLTATPLQVARLMAAVANGGKLVTPHVLSDLGLTSEREVPGATAMPVLPGHRAQTIPGLKPERLAELRAGLEAVVADPDGTGYNTIRASSVAIAGKTGTAQTGGKLPDHAWFAGYAPADAPRIAVVVALEHGGSGAEAAGPIARQVVEHLAEQGFFAGSRAR